MDGWWEKVLCNEAQYSHELNSTSTRIQTRTLCSKSGALTTRAQPPRHLKKLSSPLLNCVHIVQMSICPLCLGPGEEGDGVRGGGGGGI